MVTGYREQIAGLAGKLTATSIPRITEASYCLPQSCRYYTTNVELTSRSFLTMRRSAAPSQLAGVSKKARFVPPQRTDVDSVECVSKENIQAGSIIKSNDTGERKSEIINSDGKRTNGEEEERENVCKWKSGLNVRFRNPCNGGVQAGFKGASGPVTEANNGEQVQDCPVERYYSAMWAKASRKKHKTWEGDAVLVVRGRNLLLKNTEGKDIGKGTGYNRKELATLEEGHTLMISGKEVEIMGQITREDYDSGRCFQVSMGTTDVVEPGTGIGQHFTSSLQPRAAGDGLKPLEGRAPKPRFDPFAPNALVMPRPSLTHQRQHNNSSLSMVDVVVDPHLTSQLRPHQREGVTFLYEAIMGFRSTNVHGAILADEMGLGKTLQCVALLWTLLRQGPYGARPILRRVLIVTPGSLVRTWAREFYKWLGPERLRPYAVDQDHKVDGFCASPMQPVLLISYEMALRSVEILRSVPFGLLICDEGHRLKNAAAKTAVALNSLACPRRIILTGTPIQNDLQEFFTIVDFVSPGLLVSSSSFRKLFEEPIVASRQPDATMEEKRLGESRAGELQRLTALFTLRRTAAVNARYLPPRHEYVIFCRPTSLQLALYHRLITSTTVRSCLGSGGRFGADRSPHLVCISALRKLCNEPSLLYNCVKDSTNKAVQVKGDNEEEYYEDRGLYDGLEEEFPLGFDPEAVTEGRSGKLRVLQALLDALHRCPSPERVVLVSNSTRALDVLARCCTAWGYGTLRLDGRTPVSQRQRLVETFNLPPVSNALDVPSVFLLSSKAGGVGLSLVGASRLVLYDVDWNPANDIQAMARVWRDGQSKTVHIYRLLTTGTIEEKMYQRQVTKQALSGSVVDVGGETEHTRFSADELRHLFLLDTSTDCATHTMLACPCSGDGHPAAKDTDQQSAQACQVRRGLHKKKPVVELSMSELLSWQHVCAASLDVLPDPFIKQALSDITFVFHNENNQRPTA
uniref:DNA repair and recombination protein RAD54B isoform X2 n=1 Tax=Myxine glutinosa TaxID=7769 RepID=UPI003590237B